MSTEDDNFIREVNEELRSDLASAFWKKWGKWIIGGAVAIVAGVAINVFYQDYIKGQAAASGDVFLDGLLQAQEGQQDDALQTFEDLEASGYGAYPVLARMRAATVLADKGDAAGAIKAFKDVAGDSSIPDAIQNMAKLRAGYLLVDHGSYTDVAAEVEVLTNTTNPLRHSAREALGLAAFKEKDFTRATDWLELIRNDPQSPQQLAARAQVILELISSRSSAS